MSIAEYDGLTGKYTIYSTTGGVLLLSGTTGMDEFHRLNNAIRAAERNAEKHAKEAMALAVDEFIGDYVRGVA